MDLENQVFTTSFFERMLRIYKTNVFSEIHRKTISKLEHTLGIAKRKAHKREIKQLIDKEIEVYSRQKDRTNRYNSEVVLFIDSLIEDLHQLKDCVYDNLSMSKFRRIIDNSNNRCKDSIDKAYKYNSEVSDHIDKNNKGLDECNDAIVDFYNDFSELLFKYAMDGDNTTFINALLEESDNGNIFLNGKKYIIHINE